MTKPEAREEPEPNDYTWLYGLLILLGAMLLFVLAMFSMVFAKLLPETGHWLVDALREDWYYSLLVPLTIPVAFVAIYLNWLSMKFFRHN